MSFYMLSVDSRQWRIQELQYGGTDEKKQNKTKYNI